MNTEEKIASISKHIDEVKNITAGNIDKVIEREMQIEKLEEKSKLLSQKIQNFKKIEIKEEIDEEILSESESTNDPEKITKKIPPKVIIFIVLLVILILLTVILSLIFI
ncbi:vesicle-associated membrane protein [Anaeramoeba flamelloides]|uniref:Vesicle-associated membrane protein n=1 Tax=Anaeramoeba flamelloides TaxID=1746091 RepID=A0ABQ8Y3J1_9EUKA|nr:vesicle-associated membrane protein [Anaeramoeba flamelloides]